MYSKLLLLYTDVLKIINIFILVAIIVTKIQLLHFPVFWCQVDKWTDHHR